MQEGRFAKARPQVARAEHRSFSKWLALPLGWFQSGNMPWLGFLLFGNTHCFPTATTLGRENADCLSGLAKPMLKEDEQSQASASKRESLEAFAPSFVPSLKS